MACEASITMPVTTMADFDNLCEMMRSFAASKNISIVAEFTGHLSEMPTEDPASTLVPPSPRIVFWPSGAFISSGAW